MNQNQTSTLTTLTSKSTTLPTLNSNAKELLNHWAWKLYVYTFATLYVIFALNCLIVFARQRTRSTPKSVYWRFTTAQLFIAAVLKAVVFLWSPFLLHELSRARYGTALMLYSFSLAFNLSAYSILLLILLETTKITLVSPRLQNVWVLLAITGAFTITLATFNLLVLVADRELWRFVSDMTLYIWGTLICVGYAVAGFRIWRNLRSSRQTDNSSRQKRLRNIVFFAVISSMVTAVSLTLVICLSANDFGAIRGLDVKKDSIWVRFAVSFMLRRYEFGLVLLIFVIVIKTKAERSRVDDVPSVQLGTFHRDSEPLTSRSTAELPEE